jgi:hypothetical protein
MYQSLDHDTERHAVAMGTLRRGRGFWRRREEAAMDAAPTPPVLPSLALTNFLAWVAMRPRCYGEAMEAWRSSCPRLSVWEDALAEGLVRIAADGPCMSAAQVMLTPRGRAVLAMVAPAATQG